MDTTQITEGAQLRDIKTTPNARKSGSFGRGYPKPTQNKQKAGSPTGSTDSLGPLTAITDNMTDTDLDRVNKDARETDKELYIKDTNGKGTQYYQKPYNWRGDYYQKHNTEAETTEIDLINNLSSSTEIVQETKEHSLRRSKRLTKTNPIIRHNNPVPSHYRKHHKQTKRTEDNRYRGNHSWQSQQPRILTNTNNGPVQAE